MLHALEKFLNNGRLCNNPFVSHQQTNLNNFGYFRTDTTFAKFGLLKVNRWLFGLV